MDNVFFDNPPVLQGEEKTQLQQLYNYLFNVSNKLNEAMVTVGEQEQLVLEQRQMLAEKKETPDTRQYQTLKSLIIKTAEIVRTEMQEIATQLHGETEAISSEFGIWQQELDATIRATAEGVLQDYNYSELVQDTQTNSFYRTLTNQYIFTGLINSSPVEYGLAIGEGVTAYDANGNPYLNQNAKVATFTMNKMSFWQGTTELAYFSSGKFYIANGEITNTLQIGNYVWKKMADGSLVLVKT